MNWNIQNFKFFCEDFWVSWDIIPCVSFLSLFLYLQSLLFLFIKKVRELQYLFIYSQCLILTSLHLSHNMNMAFLLSNMNYHHPSRREKQFSWLKKIPITKTSFIPLLKNLDFPHIILTFPRVSIFNLKTHLFNRIFLSFSWLTNSLSKIT